MTATTLGIEWGLTLTLDAALATRSQLAGEQGQERCIAELEADVARREAATAPVDATEPVGAVFARVQQVHPAALDGFGQVGYLKDCARVISWAEARSHAALVAIAGATRRVQQVTLADRHDADDTLPAGAAARSVLLTDPATTEIALALRCTEHQAQTRLHVARLLSAHAPGTLVALECGQISAAHAVAIAEGISRLSTGAGVDAVAPSHEHEPDRLERFLELAAQLDTRGHNIASRSTVSHTRAAVSRIVDALDVAGAISRRAVARTQRGVWVRAEADDNALLIARLATHQAIACLHAIRDTALAARQASLEAGVPDRRGIGELRAEACANAILSGVTGGSHEPAAASTSAVVAAHVDVVVTLDALLGLTNTAGAIRGHNIDESMPAADVRDLIAAGGDVTLRRLVTDPLTGHLLDAAPERYRISDRLRDFIVARDLRCRMPGCTARAQASELDHARAFAAGGASARANLGALCKRHHLAKTHADYRIEDSRADGSCRITTPTGRTYQHEAVPILHGDEPPPF